MTIDLHPADAAHIDGLIATLRDLRHDAGLDHADVAAVLHVTPDAVEWFERGRRSPHVAAIQRHARAIGYIADLTLHGLTWATTADMRTFAAVAATATDPAVADDCARSLCIAQLAATRQRRGWTRDAVAARMGTDRAAVHHLEAERDDPLLSTYQRYARALGGWLTVELRPVGSNAAAEYRARRMANAVLPCGSRSARLRHAAKGQTCRRCGVGYEPLPDLERVEKAA